jgi:predicted DNA-binding protein
VNLTLPPEVDRVLTRLASAAGTGKASFVREWLVTMTPQLQGMAEALEAARAGQVDSFTMMAKTMRSAVQGGQQAELELKTLRRMVRKSQK